MAGTLKVDSINADSNLALKIANTAVAFIDATGLRPVAGNLNLDATATSKFYLPSANTVAIQTAGVTAVTVDSSQNVTLAGTLTTTGITNSGVATGARFNPTGSSVTGTGMYLPAANSLGFSANGNNAVYINSSQNVGIGTASPTTKLHITGNLTIENFTNSPFIDFTESGDNTDIKARIQMDQVSGTAADLLFYTEGSGTLTERMRVPSDSGIRIAMQSYASAPSSTNYGVSINNTSAGSRFFGQGSGTETQIEFGNTNGTRGSIQTNASNTLYNTTSDYRLKENVVPMANALATVLALKPCTYKWKVDGSNGQGFIAHELQEVVPDCVSGEKDAVDENGDIKPQFVDTSFLVATLTAAIQELKAIVDAQATRIVALESK